MKTPVSGVVGLGCIGIFVLALVVMVLFPLTGGHSGPARIPTCLSNEKQMGIALLQYSQDNDSTLPPAAAWMNATDAYRKARFRCPDISHGYGYAFNSELGNVETSDIADPPLKPMVYDSTKLGPNESDPITSVPMPGRHDNGNNYLFADGHAYWKSTLPPP